MKMRHPFACRHENPNHIVMTGDGERVCRCGTVLEERIPENRGYTLIQTKMSLYHAMENGGDPKDMKVVNGKLHIYSSSLSEFSNICSKLELPYFVQKDAWFRYHKLRTNTYHTRAKCAIHSIHRACCDAGIIMSESRIHDAIQMSMGVKNTPSILSVIYEMRDEAMSLNIDTDKGHSSTYYMSLAISRKQRYFSDQTDFDRFKVLVMRNFAILRGSHYNKACMAVDIALCEMGLI